MADILIQNIYYMLSYAFQALHIEKEEDVAAEDFENTADLFAGILANGIGMQIKRGLYREYITREEALSALRGKLNLSATVLLRVGARNELSCEFSELSENNPCNQVLKTAIHLLIASKDIKKERLAALKRIFPCFGQVDLVQPRQIQWNNLYVGRNNRDYRMLLNLCKLLMEGLLLCDEKGQYRLAKFIDEQRMCRLYEKFILEFYRREMPELGASAAMIDWQTADGDISMLPAMQSDVLLTKGQKKLIIDAKYYGRSVQLQYGKATIHSANLYQLFAYVKNQDAENTGDVSGMLLYAKTEEAITPNMDVMLSGNRFCARTLDLNQPFSEISTNLKKIASQCLDA